MAIILDKISFPQGTHTNTSYIISTQFLMDWCLARDTPLINVSCVHYFLRNPAQPNERQDRHANQQTLTTEKHTLIILNRLLTDIENVEWSLL